MAKVIRINAQPHATGGRFCRAGRCFGTVPTELAEDELTPKQLAALQAEPMLVVEIAEVLEPTKAQAKAEADTKAKAEADTKAKAEADAMADAKPDAKADTKPDAKAGAKPAAKEGGK
jgi:hypothetical protein